MISKIFQPKQRRCTNEKKELYVSNKKLFALSSSCAKESRQREIELKGFPPTVVTNAIKYVD